MYCQVVNHIKVRLYIGCEIPNYDCESKLEYVRKGGCTWQWLSLPK